jgi:uncharacterized surface protein with fasciclin (FAS1) repeats
METFKLYKTNNRHLLNLLILGSFLLVLTGCEIQEDYIYIYGNPGGKVNKTAWEYIQTNDSLSLMEEAIINTGLQNLYSGTEVRTYIVPRNSAFRTYLKTNKYATVSAIPVSMLSDILKYHVVKTKVIFTDPVLLPSDNPISYPTENGQVMFISHNTNYQGLINQGTKKSWTIITSNIEPTNGVIHVTADIVFLSL